jgi:hypothetical protein
MPRTQDKFTIVNLKGINAMQKRIYLPLVFVITIMIITTSCKSPILQNPTGAHTPQKLLPTLTISTLATTNTIELTTYTPTIAASKPAETITTQTTITPYPVQELSDEGKLEVMNILDEKPNCRLPCWLGLTPGISSAYEVQAFFAKLGQQIPDVEKLNPKNSNWIILEISDYPQGYLSYKHFFVSTEWQDNIVTNIMVENWGHSEQFEIKKIADVLGEPDYIKINQGTSGGIPLYSVALIFEDRNLIIKLTGRLKSNNRSDGTQFEACIYDHTNQSVDVILFSDLIKDLILKEYDGSDIPWAEWQKEIGMSKSELYDLMSNSQQCLAYQ